MMIDHLLLLISCQWITCLFGSVRFSIVSFFFPPILVQTHTHTQIERTNTNGTRNEWYKNSIICMVHLQMIGTTNVLWYVKGSISIASNTERTHQNQNWIIETHPLCVYPNRVVVTTYFLSPSAPHKYTPSSSSTHRTMKRTNNMKLRLMINLRNRVHFFQWD